MFSMIVGVGWRRWVSSQAIRQVIDGHTMWPTDIHDLHRFIVICNVKNINMLWSVICNLNHDFFLYETNTILVTVLNNASLFTFILVLLPHLPDILASIDVLAATLVLIFIGVSLSGACGARSPFGQNDSLYKV